MAVGGFAHLFQAYVWRKKAINHGETRLAHNAKEETAQESDYSKIFPPSQRNTISELIHAAENNIGPLSVSKQPLLKLECDYRLADPSTNLYSGFTVGDVRALGSFPDYAKLSGVPAPTPLKNFTIDTARPRPYRPFRWPYHQTMWSELACKELMEMALQYLGIRYPQHFRVGDGIFVNRILATTHDLSVAEPLHVLLENVPEDFAVMMRDEKTGRYHLRAGVVCSSLGWKLGQKIGMGLPGVHQAVPGYKEKLAFSVDRFFTRMPASSPIQRGSWGLEIGQPLFLPADHPDWSNRESQNESLCEEDIYLRVDWQTLRRLPLSGAIVFNFKALYTPLCEFADEPYIPSLVLKILIEGDEAIMKYKGTWHVEHVVKPALVKYEQAQLDMGLIEEGWVVQTLDESPFFPGWKRKFS
ncbi:hypothetical protein MAC_04078 [Metarhizium acridum CQMa 102]|uniref:HRQ family protein n=1 Tax=Metarhizium acridum (strain CQMa 102) TaxID=655827 RepID=E9E2I0_METAQ|nr:uncharacterized protein MAC_04078 [Metarhizium acridum CQMa 102]EFY89869.1 hypothetical protein MAC_04078 [Metarhizium acridum CQMa 102]